MTRLDERCQWQALRARQPDACAELVRGNYQTVYRFLAHLTRNVHEAEDLTQETFAAAWQGIGSFEGRATPATWLHRIAYSKLIDARRTQRRAADVLDHSPSRNDSPDPHDIASAGDEVRRLYDALSDLDPIDRAPIVLHYLQGLSYREMAVVLDEPVGTVKWRTSEALTRLRALLREDVTENAQTETNRS
jgi:RNA polymerase sigma-70 factor (ECF subfamily)